MTVQVIETSYKGYRFRSRLEARWAVFLDALGVPYSYEPEGFDLDGLWYLPDFWLPSQKCWVEIKHNPGPVGYRFEDDLGMYFPVRTGGVEPDEEFALACTKAHRLAVASKSPVVMLFDDLCPLGFTENDDIVGSNKIWHPDGSHDDGCAEWAECPLCGSFGANHAGQHNVCACICSQPFTPALRSGDWAKCWRCGASDHGKVNKSHRPWMNSRSPRLLQAYKAAKSARFEHGEAPFTPR